MQIYLINHIAKNKKEDFLINIYEDGGSEAEGKLRELLKKIGLEL